MPLLFLLAPWIIRGAFCVFRRAVKDASGQEGQYMRLTLSPIAFLFTITITENSFIFRFGCGSLQKSNA